MAKRRPDATTYTERLLQRMAREPEKVLSEIRQRMYDTLPELAVGVVGQEIVDRLVDIEASRDLSDLSYHVRLIFEDPQENRWNLDRKFKYKIDPDQVENAEHYIWQQAMALTEDDIAQLALVLT